jgi:prepilin-type N-terminal cleavage/methylation domain-containing protein
MNKARFKLRRRRNDPSHGLGFTLVELIIVIVILGIVASIGSTLLYNSLVAAVNDQNIIEATWQGRMALQRLSAELKGAQMLSADTSSTRLSFVNSRGLQVIYSLSGTYLQRSGSAASPPNPIASGVSNLNFYYLDSNVQPAANLSQARCVRVTVTISKYHTVLPLDTIACMRNL